MTGIIIKSFTLTDDSIEVNVIRKGQLVSIPVVRKDYEAWATDNNKVMWDYEPLSLETYWKEFHEDTLNRHLEEYIVVKGLVRDPMKDTFASLQSICATYKRPSYNEVPSRYQTAG